MTEPNADLRMLKGRFIGLIQLKFAVFAASLAAVLISCASTSCYAQSGSRGAGGGAGAPSAPTKPKFRDHIHSQAGIAQRREKGDAIVVGVDIVGNQNISDHEILQGLQTRQGRFYSSETVLADIRRLNDMGSFEDVSFKEQKSPDGKGIFVRFIVRERAVIQRVVFHGNHGLNDRELSGRAGLSAGDPLSEFSIESARRRMLDYYHEEGFNQAAVTTATQGKTRPGDVIFRINEGPLERIWKISVEGNTVLSEARLEKIIKSRDPLLGVIWHVGNAADLDRINEDVNVLASTYHNLGYLTATVGRRLHYHEDGKWLDVTYVVNEGPRFTVNSIQIVGNRFVTTRSLLARLKLKRGDTFDGTALRKDIGELTYGYGELGFIYAEVEPQTVMREERNVVDLVYKIEEGDRWKIRGIRVNIEGEPHLMRETTMLNLIELREGDFVNRSELEKGKRRLGGSQLLESDPQVAEPADIIVEPVEQEGR